MSEDKVIKYFEKQTQYSDKEGKNIGIVVDCETTGLDETDDMVEICVLPFSFTDDMEICKVFKPYVGFEEPRKPLSEESKFLTNLTDEELVGKNFDDGAVLSLFNKAEVSIAHNAGFDAKHVAKRFPMMKKRPWACTVNDIDWKGIYISSRTLDYIMFRYGYWFKHHRAESDCRATLHILAQEYKDGVTNFQHMMSNVFTTRVNLYALNSPYAKKDLLRSRGYRWDGSKKAWYKEMTEEETVEERKYLIGQVFFDIEIETKPINPNTRYL